MPIILVFCFCVLFAALPLNAQSAPSPEADESMLVTATRSPLPSRELGASVIVLQREDFINTAAQTVADVLRPLPGVSVRRNGGAGSNAEIMIRGDKGGHTLILVDGVELADASTIEKNLEIGDLPLTDVERIEIVKGPHSVAYGGSGLSGVIHIITRRASQPFAASVGLELGSYATRGVQAFIASRHGAFDSSVTVSQTTTAGFSQTGDRDHDEADPFTRTDASLRMGYGQGSAYSADLLLKAASSQASIDAMAGVDDSNYEAKRREILSQLTQKLRFGGRWESRLTLGLARSDRRFRDDPDAENPARDQTWSRSRYEGERRTLDFSQSLRLTADQSLTASLQWIRDAARIDDRGSYQGFAAETVLPRTSLEEFSYALQHQWGLWQRLYGQWGFRTLDNQRFGKKTVGQAALHWTVIENWTSLRLNYGRGFKTPSLYQLKIPSYGNNELRPEYASSRELALEQRLNEAFSASLTAFDNHSENLIEFDGASSRYYNIKRALLQGLESSLRWDSGKTWSGEAQYTQLRTRDEQTKKALPARPESSWSAQLQGKAQALSWAAVLRGQGRSRPGPYLDGSQGFRLLDTSIVWRQEPLRYTFKVSNVLNSWYQEVAGYNTAGRSYWGHVEYSF